MAQYMRSVSPFAASGHLCLCAMVRRCPGGLITCCGVLKDRGALPLLYAGDVFVGFCNVGAPWRTDRGIRKTTQGAYGAMRAVNRQPWYPQRRGWAQVRTPKNSVSKPPRQPPEEHLGAPPPLRSKLRLRQGAISNENAALAMRRARFQGI